MIAPAEIDRVERAVLGLVTKVVTEAVTQADAQRERVGAIIDQAVAAADEAQERATALIAQAEAAVRAAQEALANAVGAAEDELAQLRARAAEAEKQLARVRAEALEAIDKALDLGNDQLNQLKQLAQHPDWLGALMLGLTKIVELADDPNLTVHAVPAEDGFRRAMGLRLAIPAIDAAAPPSAVVALALDGEGTAGLILITRGEGPHTITSGPFSLVIDGEGTWRIPFAGPMGAPATAMTASVSLDQPTGFASDAGAILSAGAGQVTLRADLAAGPAVPVSWSIRLALVEQPPAHPAGLHAAIDLSPFLGAVADLIQVGRMEERYSPTLSLRSGRAASFDLNHAGTS
jgi:hypothetical protein